MHINIFRYRISANSFRGNYSFLSLALCTVTFDHSTYRCGNYSRAETIRGNTVSNTKHCAGLMNIDFAGVGLVLDYLGQGTNNY